MGETTDEASPIALLRAQRVASMVRPGSGYVDRTILPFCPMRSKGELHPQDSRSWLCSRGTTLAA